METTDWEALRKKLKDRNPYDIRIDLISHEAWNESVDATIEYMKAQKDRKNYGN